MRILVSAVAVSWVLAACSASTPKGEEVAAASPQAEFKTVAASEAAAPGALQTVLRLTRQHWQLAAATDAKGQRIDALFVRADKPLQLDFNASTLSVGNACNTLSAHHVATADSLTVDPMATTLMACPDPKLQALDQEVGKRLQGHLGVRFEGDAAAPKLVLTNAAGDVLTFAGKPTAEARYGGPGEQLFLEVAAASKPCSHPLMPNHQCLQVRELRYDEKGLKVGTPPAFENFYDAIEGYTHEAGVRNVLRVKRYTVANPPADASKYAYVLDMVVESDASGK